MSVEFANVVSGQSATAQGATDAGARPDADRARIAEAAKQFEAMFLLQMLKQMRQSMLADENEEPGLGAGTMFDTIDAELSKQLAGQSWRVGFDDVRGDVEGGREWSILDLDAFARASGNFVEPGAAAAPVARARDRRQDRGGVRDDVGGWGHHVGLRMAKGSVHRNVPVPRGRGYPGVIRKGRGHRGCRSGRGGGRRRRVRPVRRSSSTLPGSARGTRTCRRLTSRPGRQSRADRS